MKILFVMNILCRCEWFERNVNILVNLLKLGEEVLFLWKYFGYFDIDS